LPTDVQQGINEVHTLLFGEPLGEADSTWTVFAKEGSFSKLYGPTFGKETSDEKTTLSLKWGKRIATAEVKGGKLVFAPGVTGKFSTATINGYPAVVVLLKTKAYMFPVAIRLASFDEDSRPDMDTFESLLEANELQTLMDLLGELPSSSGSGPTLTGEVVPLGQLPVGDYTITAVKKINSDYTPYFVQSTALVDFAPIVSFKDGDEWKNKTIEVKAGDEIIIKIPADMATLITSHSDDQVNFDIFGLNVDASMREVQLVGPVVKVSELPLDSYLITGYRSINSKYTPFLVQTIAPQDMEVPSSRKVNGEWESFTATLKEGDPFIIKPNGKLAETLEARPIVTDEAPGELILLEAGTYNGFKTMKLTTNFNTFSVRPNELRLNF
jgi:hypothetical protein